MANTLERRNKIENKMNKNPFPMCNIRLRQTSNCCSRCFIFIAKNETKECQTEVIRDFVFDESVKVRVVGNYLRDKRRQDKLFA